MRKITRKLCVFLLTCVSISLLYAQQDVTAMYLNNADFDENPTFMGSNSTANATTVGYGYVISGWDTYASGGSNYGRVATANYGITFESHPDVLNGVNPPSNDINGNSDGAVLMMSGSWAGIVQLTQNVTLPAGKYELVFDVITQSVNREFLTNYFGFISDEGIEFYSSKTEFTNEWATERVEFTLTKQTSGKVSIGHVGLGIGAGSIAKLAVDNVRLLYYGLDKSDLEIKIQEAESIIIAGSPGETYMNEVIFAAKEVYNKTSPSADEIVEVIEKLDIAINAYFDGALSDLKVNGRTINGFAAEIFDYTYYISNNFLPTVLPTASEAADINMTLATEIPGNTTIVVTAGNGSVQTYTISFIFDLNLMAGWDYSGQNGTPGNAGWIFSLGTPWNTVNIGEHCYRDNIEYNEFKGRVLTTGYYDGPVYAYPVTLQEGKEYEFTALLGAINGGTNPASFNIDFNTSTDREGGTSLASRTYSIPQTTLNTQANLQFIAPASGVFYFTFQGTTGTRGLLAELALVEVGNTFKVTFDTNGGSSIEDEYVVEGNAATRPNDPTKTGYLFRGWYSDAELIVEYDFSAPIIAETIIYAKWEDLKGELKEMIETAGELLEGGTEKGKIYLQEAITVSQVIVDNEEATEELIEDAYNFLIIAINTYQDASLLDLRINDVTISGFLATTYDYVYSLDSDENIPFVIAEGNECADITIESTIQLPGKTIIKVIAGDGSVKIYTVNFAINLMTGWDLNGQNGTPGEAGWVSTNPSEWNSVDSSAGSHCYRDNINIDAFSGRTLTTAPSDTYIYAYPVELIGGKVYNFTGRFGIINQGSNPASTNFDFNTKADRENGVSLVSRTQSMAQQTFNTYPEASFFVPVTGTYYFTFQVTSGARALLANLTLVEVTSISNSKLSSFSDGALSEIEHLVLEGDFTNDNISTLAAKLGNNEALTTIDLTDAAVDNNAIDIFVAINANNLKYFADGATVPANWTNAVIGDTADEIVLTDGAPFNNIQAFTATSISYTRTFVSGWSTFCLPFTIDEITGLGTIEEFTEVKDNKAIAFVTATSIEANRPYLINTTDGETLFSANNVEVPVTDLQTGIFNATFKTLPKEESTGKYILVEEDGKELFLRASATATIPAFRAYISMPDNASTPSYSVVHNGEGGITNIAEIASGKDGLNVYSSNGVLVITATVAQQVTITSIDGYRVQTIVLAAGESVAINNLAAGIYLVNKQKVVVR